MPPRHRGAIAFSCQVAAIGRYLLTLVVLRALTFIPPFEATLGDRLPEGEDWLYEVNGGAIDPAEPRILAWRHRPCATCRWVNYVGLGLLQRCGRTTDGL